MVIAPSPPPGPPPPSPPPSNSAEQAIAETWAWLDHAVIGLNLCPFAPGPRAAGRVRLVCCEAEAPQELLTVLVDEMRLLDAADPQTVETTLLVHPRVLLDFLDYNDFLDLADDALEALELDGVLQIASFHPDYRFAGTEADDIGNATNRSPHPTLQLLREASVARAVGGDGDRATDADDAGSAHGIDDDDDDDNDHDGPGPADAIIQANQRTLAALGHQGWAALQARCRREAAEAVGRGPGSTDATAPHPLPERKP